MAKKSASDDYEASLIKSYSHWDSLYKNGGQDPFWPDSANLNLIRNHILNDKRLITETMPPERYPDIYYRDTPPIVEHGYMARADEIRQNAKASLESIKTGDGYKYLYNHVNSLDTKDKNLNSIRWAANTVKGLEKAIIDDDLVTMRRFEEPGRHIESIDSAAERLRELLHRDRQLSLFDYNDENAEDEEMEW